MFKVETTGLYRILDVFMGLICAGLLAAMAIFFPDMYAYFSGFTAKLVASVIYIGIMLLMVLMGYSSFDEAAKYMLVERNEFRIKHLFRKEVTYTREQLDRWECYTQFLRNGQSSENILIVFDTKAKIEFYIFACTNFERLLDYLNRDFKRKRGKK